ncbi:hypothetical protein [Aurantiacibacter odishensis]|uniref:hypothetical protein n=1 Tax=Aurantiacibacter odishensis TaxID=1155476 RepID=UPI0013C524AF|nr:hypothetical protein [Aurantiacibacter odishensis]
MLLDANVPFFVRGSTLVRPVSDELAASYGNTTKVHRLVEVEIRTLIDHLSRATKWKRYHKQLGTWVPIDPPRKVAETILARDGEWGFPRISGIIGTPTLRPDGTILSSPGYDKLTRLYLADPVMMPSIPLRPSKQQAERGLNLLNSLLEEFPFADRASRSVALSALITPIVRGAIPVAPLHTISAPVAGSGKSYIVDLASVISTGQRAPVLSAGKHEDETDKRVAAALLDGHPVISIDNVNGDLGGDQLCQAVERPIVSLRPLGRSELVRVESYATWFATGNNIQLVGDMVRRTIQCKLDPQVERPELREFAADPVQTVLADRGQFIAAALTVVRAYQVAGCPEPMPPLGSFEEWNRLVRSTLVWLGQDDPLKTMSSVRNLDPAIADLGALLRAWHRAAGDDCKTTGDVVTLALDLNPFGNRCHEDLYQALLAISEGRRGEPDPRKLGYYLRREEGRIVDNLRFQSMYDGHAKQKLWSVRRV